MTPVSKVARWDGTQWQPVGQGVVGSGYVRSLRAFPDGLYAAGWFTYMDTVLANGLARWDGTQWHRVHDLPLFSTIAGVNGINDVMQYNGDIYIGGNIFDDLGVRNDIAKWDGSDWVALNGQGFLGTYSVVNRFELHAGLLYVAGSFANYPPNGHPNNPGNGILAFDGSNWMELAGGTDGAPNPTVMNMVWRQDTLYAQGIFTRIGGVPCDRLAKWDGARWCAMTPPPFPSYFNAGVSSLGFFRDTLYVGGAFTMCGPDSIRAIAKWVGGAFVDSCGTAVGLPEPVDDTPWLRIYPNPSSERITLHTPPGLLPGAQIRIRDMLGRELRHERLREDRAVDVSTLAAGCYTLLLMDTHGNLAGYGRFVKD